MSVSNSNARPLRKLLKPKEAAEYLAISERKLWSLTNSKQIPYVRIDKSIRYSVEDLDDWIESKRVSSRK